MKNRTNEEIGLAAGIILGKHLLGMEHLHYGYWTEELRPDIRNLAQAQENYCEFLMSHIPEGVETILDVGCGTGKFALDLINRGYRVDCVSPGDSLAKRARDLLQDRSRVFTCRYEDVQTEKRYDAVLFAESFQYIDMEPALRKTLDLLNDGGRLVICDLFKTDAPGRCALRGGYHFSRFTEIISRMPYEPVEDIDITKETAPNIDIGNDLLRQVLNPLVDLADSALRERRPWIHKVLRWKFRKRLEKLDRHFLREDRTGECFAIFKTYRFLLYRKESAL